MFSLSQAGKGGEPGPTLGRAPSCPHLLPDQGPLTMDKGEEDDDEEAWLQLRPVEPLPSQCCGSGCSPCVFDLYQRDLASWEAARASKDRSLLSGEETQVRESSVHWPQPCAVYNKYSLPSSFTSNRPVSLRPYTILFTMILNLSYKIPLFSLYCIYIKFNLEM